MIYQLDKKSKGGLDQLEHKGIENTQSLILVLPRSLKCLKHD